MTEEMMLKLQELDSLVGLEGVKQNIREIVMVKMHYKSKEPGYYVFAGNSRTGKTVVARKMGEILKAAGILEKGHVVECRPDDLVASYIGQTALKARSVYERAIGGVLFVDEADGFLNRDEGGMGSSFHGEALTELIAFLEIHCKELCVIFSVHPTKVDRFLNVNPGMRSRITEFFRFD